jgi:hypothetical protein
MEVNWDDLMKAAGDAALEALPPDTYDVTVDSAEATESSTGKPMIKVRFKVQGGPYDQKTVFNQFVISYDSNVALNFFFRYMAALGLGEAFFAAKPPMAQVASALVGRRCQVKLSQREWPAGSGQIRNNVDNVLAPTGGGVSPVAAPASTGLPGLPGSTTAAPLPTGTVAMTTSSPTAVSYAPPSSAVPPPPVRDAVPPPPPPSLDDELPF